MEQNSATIGKMIQGFLQRHGMIALVLRNCEQPGLCAGRGMRVNRAPVGDDKTLGAERLQTHVVGPGRNGALDPGGQQLFEGREQDVLQVDGQRQ